MKKFDFSIVLDNIFLNGPLEDSINSFNPEDHGEQQILDTIKEFKNMKKAALAKKIGVQRDEIKALNDQIKMQQEQIRELTKANDEKDGLLSTKQVYIDKLQQRVADLKKAHGIK